MSAGNTAKVDLGKTTAAVALETAKRIFSGSLPPGMDAITAIQSDVLEAIRTAFAKLWISVETQLPDSDLTVLIHTPTECDPVWMGYHNGDAWHCVEGGLPVHVTHWMPIPEPPTPAAHQSH